MIAYSIPIKVIHILEINEMEFLGLDWILDFTFIGLDRVWVLTEWRRMIRGFRKLNPSKTLFVILLVYDHMRCKENEHFWYFPSLDREPF